MRGWWVMCALGAGCTKDPGEQGPSDTGGDEDDVADEAPGEVCDAALAARAGFSDYRVPLSWTQGANGWVARSDTVRIPDDVVGLSIHLDAGTRFVPIRKATLGDRVLIDLVDGRPFGASQSRRRRASLFDTFDTFGWDTFDTFGWDTFDTFGWDTFDTGFFDSGFWDPGDSGTEPPQPVCTPRGEVRLRPSLEPLRYPAVVGPVAGIGLPANAESKPWGGCLQVVATWPCDEQPPSTQLDVVVQTAPVAERVGFRVHAFRLPQSGLTVREVQDTMQAASRLLSGGGGPPIAEVEVFDLSGVPALVGYNQAQVISDIVSTRVDAPLSRLAVQVVFGRDALDGEGLLGFASGIPGPARIGTAASGMFVFVDPHRGTGDLVDAMSSTIAHEVGHQLGLFHTSEATGEVHDVLDDTPECRATNASGVTDVGTCPDGTNLMFWSAGPETTGLSAQQALVLSSHPAALP